MTVSVIIPTWNRAETLRRAIQSVLDQTVPVLEILICDDGSTDNSQEVVRSLASKRVSWLEGSHQGLPAVARNRGLAVARGEWIAFLDSDDEWLPNKLQVQLGALTESNAGAVCSNAFRLLPEQESQKQTYFPGIEHKSIILDNLLKTNGVICSSMMVHQSILKIVHGFPESPTLKAIEDYALWLRVACLTPILYLSEPLVHYYDNPSESVRQDDVSPLEQRIRVLQDASQWAEQNQWLLIQKKTRLKLKHALNTALGISDTSIVNNIKKIVKAILIRL